MGRFLNADAVYDTDAGLQGYNIFIYCGNNPVNRIDISGADSIAMADGDVDEDDPFSVDGGGSDGKISDSPPAAGGTGGGNNYTCGYNPPPGGGGITNTIQIGETTVTFSHGGRHLEGTQFTTQQVEPTIAQNVVVANPSLNTYYKGFVNINGTQFVYSGFRLSSTLINVGSYHIDNVLPYTVR